MSMVHTGILHHYYVQIQYKVHADTDRTRVFVINKNAYLKISGDTSIGHNVWEHYICLSIAGHTVYQLENHYCPLEQKHCTQCRMTQNSYIWSVFSDEVELVLPMSYIAVTIVCVCHHCTCGWGRESIGSVE